MWLAQRENLPDTHKLWADVGSTLEATLRAVGYVDVPAPGQQGDAENLDDTGDEPEQPTADTKKRGGKS